MKKFFIYELRKKIGPAASIFDGYLFYNSTDEKILCSIVEKNLRVARRMCYETAEEITNSLKDAVIVWRDWPIVFTGEKQEDFILENIKKREI